LVGKTNQTLDEVKSTLEDSEKTLRNTQPYAVLEFQRLAPFLPSFPIKVGQPLEFNMAYTNSGNAIADNVYVGVKFYVGKLDDEATQKKLASDFDKWWATEEHHMKSPLRPRAPSFGSFKTDAFTADQIKDITSRTQTIYVLIRFAYTDHTGRWMGDECMAMQDPNHDLMVGHPCKYHSNPRYETRWRPPHGASKHGQ
jgi:hypothetical protein